MTEIVITLVFSLVMLVFMAFPSMKIVDFIEKKVKLSETAHNILLIGITIVLSLLIGVFLKFA